MDMTISIFEENRFTLSSFQSKNLQSESGNRRYASASSDKKCHVSLLESFPSTLMVTKRIQRIYG